MPLSLCSVCRAIFESRLVLNRERHHHQTPDGFVQASEICYICRTITTSDMWKEVERRIKLTDEIPPATWYLAPQTFKNPDEKATTTWYKLTIDHDWGENDDELFPPSEDDTGDLKDFYPATPIWEFRVHSSKDDIGKEQDLPLGLQNSRMLDLPKMWYKQCQDAHPLCAPPDPTFRPTRLIEIVDEISARLIISKNESVKESYVAFSHCWGKAKTLKLLESNMEQLQSGVKDSDVPTSYNEALLVCRSMGFRYIWIDSLCIIQDSFEDWQKEALTMKDVYQNSALNLCASAAAENSDASFTARDVSLIYPLAIRPSWVASYAQDEQWYISKFDMYDEEVETSPLISRAWVVQEHYLSHRSLHMTKSQLWFGCRQGLACESYAHGFPKASLTQYAQRAENEGTAKIEANKGQHNTRWYKLVEDYARCGLTVSTDKLIAFAGVAQTFKRYFRDDQYLAGIWRSQLPLALCWSTTQSTQTYRPRKYIAPSWSWASVKGVIHFPLIMDRICYDDDRMKDPSAVHCDVLDARIGLKDARYDTGQIVSGQLDLSVHLVGPVDWEASEGDDESESGVLVLGSKKDPQFTIGFEHGGEVTFDERSRDGQIRMAWLDGTSTEENPEDEAESTAPVSFLIPIAEFTAETCDPPHAPAMFGIIVCKVDTTDGTRYFRVGNFEHLVFPPEILDAFPQQQITVD